MPVTVAAIIPTHKRPELIGRAIESVLNQSIQVEEVIVVDDAACDLTRDRVSAFGSARVKYLRNPQAGAGSSRNLGARISQCDYIAFLDDDDEWSPDKIKKQKEYIEKEDLDLCFSRIKIIYEGTNISYLTKTSMPEDLKKSICIENFIGGTISSIIKRELFLSINGFDQSFKAREEYDLWIRLIHAGARVGIVEEGLSVAYRSINERARISSSVLRYEEAIRHLNKKHGELVETVLSPSEQRLRRRKQYEFLAAQAVSVGARMEGCRYYWGSLKLRFSWKVVCMALVCFLHPALLIRLRALAG